MSGFATHAVVSQTSVVRVDADVPPEIAALLGSITRSLSGRGSPRTLLERATIALLDYIEGSTDGFRILVRDSPVTQTTGSFASLISDIARQVDDVFPAGTDISLKPLGIRDASGVSPRRMTGGRRSCGSGPPAGVLTCR